MHLIIIDDDPSTRMIIRAYYERKGWLISEASTPPEALEAINNGGQMILLDQVMPEINGMDFLEQLKQSREELPPVLMMTGNSSIHLAITFMKKGGCDFIEKPLDFDILTIKLERSFNTWMERKRHLDWKIEAKKALEIAKENAEEENRQKSIFMAALGYDMRTPLSSICGFCDLISSRNKEDLETQKYTSLIKMSADYMITMATDILSLAQVETNTINLNYEPVYIKEIFDQIKTYIEVKGDSSEVAINFHIGEDVPEHCFSDPIRLKQVLSSLVENAMKFTCEGQIDISCELKSDSEQSWLLEFTVKDTGPGVIPEIREHLFDCFNRANNNYAKQFGGTGMGLTVCRKLTELLGGEISCDSQSGEGATFRFTVLALKSLNCEASEWNENAPPVLNNLNILVAEDCITNQVIITKVLESLGHEVILVKNGLEAVKNLSKSKFNCIIMDLMLPVMNGLQATEAIRKIDADIPIFGYTVSRDQDLVKSALSAGMNSVIHKPMRRNDLLNLLGSVMPSS